MADVRSSSALVGELTQLLPSEMVLERFQVEGSRLSVDGTVLQPNGLRTINAFLLQLAQSSLFDPKKVQLEKAEVNATSGDLASVMRFSLNAAFRGDAAVLTRPRLDLLGASGLATRMRFLESEQLLP
nr:PilN domain-containing protein [Synechococcus sp. N32]